MKTYDITVNGVTYEVVVEEKNEHTASATTSKPEIPAAPASTDPKPAAAPSGRATVNAPMPGTILRLNVKVGDKIEKDSLVCIMEAMKMENEIFAPVSGTVAAINAPQGASVSSGDVIVTLA